MDIILSIPYSYGDMNDGFEYNNEYGKLTSDRYVKIIMDNYNKYKGNITYLVSTRYGKNMSINNLEKESNEYRQITQYFYDTDCILFNDDEQSMSVDELIRYHNTEEEFAMIFKLNFNPNDLINTQEIDTEIRQWWSETSKIMNSNKLTDEEKMMNLPFKDLKIKLKKEGSLAILEKCKLVDRYDRNTFALIVKRITFVVEK